MGAALGDGHDGHENTGAGVAGQDGHGDDAADEGAAYPLVAALQGLRKAAAQDDGDGEQDPVRMGTAPGQVDGGGVAAAHGECCADGVAQLGGFPAPDGEDGAERPAGGTDEHLPVAAHDGQVGGQFAAGGVRQAQDFVVDVADAVGHAAHEHGGGGAEHQAVLFGVVGRADGGNAGATVDGRPRFQAEEEAVGHVVDFGGQFVQHGAHLGQGVAVAGVAAQGVQFQLAGQQLVADVEGDDEHAGNALPERGTGRFEHEVAGGLHLLGQGGLGLEKLAEHGVLLFLAVLLADVLELAGFDADEISQRQQHVGHGQCPVAGIEDEVPEGGPQDEDAGADAEVEGVDEGWLGGAGLVGGYREDSGEHHAHGHRNAPLAPGHGQEGHEGEQGDDDELFEVASVEALHGPEDGQAEDDGGQHGAELAAPGADDIRRGGGDDAGGGQCGGVGPQPEVDDDRDEQKAQTGGDAVGDVVAEQDAQGGTAAGREFEAAHGGYPLSPDFTGLGEGRRDGVWWGLCFVRVRNG